MPGMQTSFAGLVELLAKNRYPEADDFIRELVQNPTTHSLDGEGRRLIDEREERGDREPNGLGVTVPDRPPLPAGRRLDRDPLLVHDATIAVVPTSRDGR